MAEQGPDRMEIAGRQSRPLRLLGDFTPGIGCLAPARACLGLLLFGWAATVVVPSAGHPLSLQECFEGGDFIAHAAEARDNGMTKGEFVDRLVADVYLIQAFPPELRWFVVDPDDAEFLEFEASRVFDSPRPPETHRADFLSRCFDR
jgi:hypothetical protein